MSCDAGRKLERLRSYFRELDGAVVAYSGGVDSSVLAKTAHDVLGKKAIAVTIDSPTVDKAELDYAKNLALSIGIRHRTVKHDALRNECFRRNAPDRCYHCKKEILSVLKKVARKEGIKAVVEGTNAEEILGHRPGYKAVKEGGVYSPLAELGYKKKDIREIAAYLKLPNADKPSMACLASRIPYGTEITKGLLGRIAKAEAAVRSTGVKQLRVRCFDDIAMIEVYPEDFSRIFDNKERISKKMRSLGFKRVVLDLDGYSTGSMSRKWKAEMPT